MKLFNMLFEVGFTGFVRFVYDASNFIINFCTNFFEFLNNLFTYFLTAHFNKWCKVSK